MFPFKWPGGVRCATWSCGIARDSTAIDAGFESWRAHGQRRGKFLLPCATAPCDSGKHIACPGAMSGDLLCCLQLSASIPSLSAGKGFITAIMRLLTTRIRIACGGAMSSNLLLPANIVTYAQSVGCWKSFASPSNGCIPATVPSILLHCGCPCLLGIRSGLAVNMAG
jgi:hypothetical protein